VARALLPPRSILGSCHRLQIFNAPVQPIVAHFLEDSISI